IRASRADRVVRRIGGENVVLQKASGVFDRLAGMRELVDLVVHELGDVRRVAGDAVIEAVAADVPRDANEVVGVGRQRNRERLRGAAIGALGGNQRADGVVGIQVVYLK